MNLQYRKHASCQARGIGWFRPGILLWQGVRCADRRIVMYRQYEMMELAFVGQEPEGSKAIIDLEAVFIYEGKDKAEAPAETVNPCAAPCHSSNETQGKPSKKVKGFYAGDNTYKVRFLPEEAGRYTYRVTGMIEAEGSFAVEPHDDKHHGIVRPEGTHLRHADGTYLATFGTTVYALAHQDRALTEETFRSLECGAFNKIRMCVFPKHYEYNKNEPEHFAFFRDEEAKDLCFTDNLGAKRCVKPFDTDQPDPAFWDEFEKKLERLFDMGIQVDLILFHPYDRWGHSHMSQESNLTYLDYVIRRLAAYPNIWWSMANEYDLFFDWKREQWHEIDEFLAANDPYRHMLSNHNCFEPYDYSRKAVTHVSLQNRFLGRVPELQARFGKPVCYDECCYEGNLKESWGNISAPEMVNRFWKVTISGGYCTHGEVLLDDDIETKEQQDAAVLWWAKGGKLKGQSPKRIRFLKELVAELPGPIDPMVNGLDFLLTTPREALKESAQGMPDHMRGFFNTVLGMSEKELLIHMIPEVTYAGHVGDEVYLYYYGNECPARVRPTFAEGRTYRIEVIDAWNMTRHPAGCGVKSGQEIRLPGREYMAVLAVAEK